MTKIKPEAKVGDFLISPAVKTSTSGVHDNPTNEERDRRKEDDERQAKHSPGVPTPGQEPTPGEVRAGAEMDASLAAAREGVGPDQEIPIAVVDPVSGTRFEIP
jgi:hypothetical protein